MRDEVVAVLSAEGDESATAFALKEGISSAVVSRLATMSTTETGGAVLRPTPRRETVPGSSHNFADPNGSVPGINMMDPHSEGKAIYLPTVHGVIGGTTENFPSTPAGTGGPRGTENCSGLPGTGNRDLHRSSRISSPGPRGTEGNTHSIPT